MSEVENLIKKKAEKVDQDFNSILEDIYEETIEPRIKKRLEFLLEDSGDLMTEIYAEIEIGLSEDTFLINGLKSQFIGCVQRYRKIQDLLKEVG